MSQNRISKWWETKAPADFSKDEWEALCDGCAKCCLLKLEDEDTGEVVQTNVCCSYLDLSNSRCTCYSQRQSLVPTCVVLSPENFRSISFLPDTCAYRYLAEGKPLPAWHPLISGDSQSVHDADMSIGSWATPEHEVEDIMEHIIVPFS